MSKLKKLYKNVRIIVLVVFLVLALFAIRPDPWTEGVAIRSVIQNSSAALAGLENPPPGRAPMDREKIETINNIPIKTVEDFYDFTASLTYNRSFVVRTNKGTYRLTTKPLYEVTILNETELVNVTNEVYNETTNETINVTETIEVQKIKKDIIGMEDIGLNIYEAPTSNIVLGLDLAGGTRVILKPAEKVSNTEMEIVLENIKERLNVFGLSDISVRSVNDLTGDKFVLVEIPGANKEEVKELLSKQGKFEARISNQTVFAGGKKDITSICRSADCSGIDPRAGCGKNGDQWACRFYFSISISQEAAETHAEVTNKLDVVIEDGKEYLNESIYLYLDDVEVDMLRIGAELKGNVVTDIQISGSGSGLTEQEAMFNALENMKRMQTVLETGSLPVKLEIVKTDTISPLLGKEFIRNAIMIGLLSIAAVVIVVFIRYRRAVISLPMIITMGSEAIILLGFAALIRWRIDLAAIAGIIIAIGTGVDHQIVIADETFKGAKTAYLSWKDKLKRAFFIIMGAYFTTVVAMVPLLLAGAGLIKGFAITTIIGVSIGVFVTRPAYAAIIEILGKD